MMKRVLSIVLVIALLAIAIPFQALTVSAADSLIWPCESAYTVTCMYYYKDGSQHSTRYGYQTAMDISGGGNILAAESGVVETATDLGNSGFGRYVVIKHDSGSRTLYGHMSSYSVSVGQYVNKGQKIGVMGSTGNSSGTHLHFEYSNGDPWKLFYRGQYASKLVFEQNVHDNNNKFNQDKTIVNVLSQEYEKRNGYYYYVGTPYDVDSRYPTPFKAYTLQNADQPAYDGVNGNQIGRMFATDHVTIEAVYTNGWVKANCPWQGYTNGRTIYAPLSTFLNTSFTPKTIQATTKTQCYYRSDRSSSPGYIYEGDTCVQVGESGDYVCVLCPWSSGGYYLVWSHKSAFAHTHSYSGWSKYDGSYHSRSCSCGNVEKQAHTWNSGTVTKQATCTSSGVKTYTCTVCNATKTETISVKDHTWDNGTVTVAATCGSNGVRTYKCSGCGGTYTQEIAATGAHKYDNDCDESCNVCGDLRALLGHAYESAVTTAATCGADGVMTYTCTSCGDSYTESIPATGEHKYDNDCDASCNVCGVERTTGAHSYKSSVTTAATCGAAGVRTYTCGYCGDSYTESIPATGEHKYDNDCDASCNVCGAERTVGAHSYKSSVTTAATCGAAGVRTYTCGYCGDSYTESISATGKHTYDGDADASCNVCGAVREVLDENAPAFVVDSVNTFAGQTITVAIRTQRNSGIVSMKLNLFYDSDLLELVSYEEKDFANMSFSPAESNPFVINWVDALNPNNTTDGVVLLLTFRVKDDAPAGETTLTLTYDADDVYDEDFNNVGFTVVNGTVTIRDYVPGDVNGDGKVNNKDLGQLQRYLNAWNVSLNEKAADVNGDGKINNKDLGVLQRYLNGWNVELV